MLQRIKFNAYRGSNSNVFVESIRGMKRSFSFSQKSDREFFENDEIRFGTMELKRKFWMKVLKFLRAFKVSIGV